MCSAAAKYSPPPPIHRPKTAISDAIILTRKEGEREGSLYHLVHLDKAEGRKDSSLALLAPLIQVWEEKEPLSRARLHLQGLGVVSKASTKATSSMEPMSCNL